MSKKIISLLLASTLLVSVQMTQGSAPAIAEEMVGSVNVDNLVDVTPNHWAYDAVKLVTQELGIMPPKTPTRFMGNDTTTRYEVAQAFYNTARRLETSSGKDLKVTGDARQTSLSDVDSNYKSVVDSVINEYGIMQAMPGNKFMGNEKMTRYELAFELNNYLSLLVKKAGRLNLDPISRAEGLTDVKEEHWATPAIRNVVDNAQLMAGYPDNTFRGYQTLTRYELAAVLRKFVDLVDKSLVTETSAVPTMVPTPMPTMEPTAEPTPMPSMEPAKKPLSAFDLKVGGGVRTGYTTTANTTTGLLYGPSAQLDLRFGAFQIGGNAEYMLYDQGAFAATSGINNLAKLDAGADLGWRMLGNESDEDTSLYIGVGYNYFSWMGQMANGSGAYNYMNHGPRARVALEIPIGGAFSIFGEDTFTYFIAPNTSFANNIQWKNEGFAGVTIPAYTLFSVQLGYRDTRYVLTGKPTVYGDIGGLANLRFRF
ncbi:MAG: hypothetical protein EOO89_23905 [Pedobacter sp.]|nr:MAG: hypothetical protein EOO89_23905 [Pedobacter sp.]